MWIPIERYSVSSGKKINVDNSCIQFNATTRETTKSIIAKTLGIRAVEDAEKYLGLPMNWRRSK